MRRRPPFITGVPALFSAAALAALTGCGDAGSGSRGPDAARPDAATASPHTRAANAAAFDSSKKALKLSTGITVSYVEAGDPGGEVVVMLHGWTDTSRSFYPVIEALVAENPRFHIYALDQRGHGAASMPEARGCASMPGKCFEIADFRDDLLAFMDARNIPTAHIVGHSLGTLVGQELALSDAHRVESLVLIGTTVSGSDNAVFLALRDELIEGRDASMGHWRALLEQSTAGFRWPEDAYELRPAHADPNVGSFIENVWVTELSADPAFLAEIVPETADIRIGTWIGALHGLIRFSSRDRLRRLTVPTLVIWATQDALFLHDPDQSGMLAELDAAIDGCNLPYYFYKTYGKEPLPSDETQTDLGHNTHWGAYQGVAADIASWLTADEPTGDLTYTNPGTAGSVRSEAGAAMIIERRRDETCSGSRAAGRQSGRAASIPQALGIPPVLRSAAVTAAVAATARFGGDGHRHDVRR